VPPFCIFNANKGFAFANALRLQKVCCRKQRLCRTAPCAAFASKSFSRMSCKKKYTFVKTLRSRKPCFAEVTSSPDSSLSLSDLNRQSLKPLCENTAAFVCGHKRPAAQAASVSLLGLDFTKDNNDCTVQIGCEIIIYYFFWTCQIYLMAHYLFCVI